MKQVGHFVLPSYNEATRLPAVLEQLSNLEGLHGEWRCIVVDDGSRDDTSAVARKHGATVLRHPFNLGYGAALQTGYKYALESGADFLVQLDADGQHDPAHIPGLMEPIEKDEADLVIGSRFVEATAYDMGLVRTIGRLGMQFIARFSNLSMTDPTSGYQAMNRVVLELYSGAFFPSDYPDVDVLLMAHRNGLRIQERSVEMSAGTRASTLHGGTRSFYYVYRMMLSLWAGAKQRKT